MSEARFAVIGDPVAHSRSPGIHEAFAAQFGLAIGYERIAVPADELVEHLAALHGQGSVKLFTNEHPEGIEMMDTEGAPLGYMDSFGPQLENLVRAHAQSLSLARRQLSYVP